jgi:hypothetical protein
MDDGKLRISKIEAARRQLDCAIQLWFMDGDEVSIHTLACAAYQLVHDIKENKALDKALLYDTDMIKEEFRKEWIKLIKRPMNFFKHADNDADEDIEFAPLDSIGFIMAASAGLHLLGEKPSFTVNALTLWFVLHKPKWVKPHIVKFYEDRFGIEYLQQVKTTVEKDQFLHVYLATSEAREPAAIEHPIGMTEARNDLAIAVGGKTSGKGADAVDAEHRHELVIEKTLRGQRDMDREHPFGAGIEPGRDAADVVHDRAEGDRADAAGEKRVGFDEREKRVDHSTLRPSCWPLMFLAK